MLALVQALLYLAAVALLVVAALKVPPLRVSLALLGAACALLAYSLPTMAAGVHAG